MFNKKALIAAALVVGLASAAQAGSRDDDESGGFRVGPLGQMFTDGVNPVYHPSLRNALAYVAPHGQSPHKKANHR